MSAALRPLTAADVGALVALERALFGPSAWTEAMIREELAAPGRWYVGVDGPSAEHAAPVLLGSTAPDLLGSTAPALLGSTVPDLLGYVGAWFDGDVVQVMTIGVAPHAQRRGLGTVLLDGLLAHARDVGAQSVLLEVRVDNDPAIALYERAGFTVLGRRHRYYQPEDVDAWTMRKEL